MLLAPEEPAIDDLDGQPVKTFLLTNALGSELQLLDRGATWYSALIALSNGEKRQVLLGGRTVADHLQQTAYMGASVGRYANRIAGGHLSYLGQQWQLPCNQNGNTLHGGPRGLSHRRWTLVTQQKNSLTLAITSPHLDQGFPGQLQVTMTITLDDRNQVVIEYRATCDQPTPVNLTNHAYFNLSDNCNSTIAEHQFRLTAETFIPVNDTGIPIGTEQQVVDSAFDLRQLQPLNKVLDDPQHRQQNGGIDHSYLLDPQRHTDEAVATLVSDDRRLSLNVATTQPALHVYTGNFLAGEPARNGEQYQRFSGIALESQCIPDAPNQPQLPGSDCWLAPGVEYYHKTLFQFVG